jgi:hypothetical protein
MITSVSILLRELMEREAAKLAREHMTHPPTIGAMYEGLTRDILDRAVPASLNLHIIEGFIEDAQGRLSPQVDVMLVAGEGRHVPFTSSYVWPIQDVIAVLEVKKNLFGADFDDAFRKLRSVMQMHVEFLQRGVGSAPNIQPPFQGFARLTGRYPRTWHAADALPHELSSIFHTLMTEQLGPVRIILGYEGYRDEFSLRKGLIEYLDDHLATPAGFGIGSFPNLIVCRKNSLLKMNGQPYISTMIDGWWPAIVSNSENPIRLLIELIWTRRSNQFQKQLPMDDTLRMERLAPLLSTRFAERNGLIGWEYRFDPLARKQLAAIEPTSWEPEAIDEHACIILIQVARLGELDVRDEAFRRFTMNRGVDPDRLIAGLVDRRMLAWSDDHTVRLLTTGPLFTGFAPDGRTLVTEKTDLLDLWLHEQP